MGMKGGKIMIIQQKSRTDYQKNRQIELESGKDIGHMRIFQTSNRLLVGDLSGHITVYSLKKLYKWKILYQSKHRFFFNFDKSFDSRKGVIYGAFSAMNQMFVSENYRKSKSHFINRHEDKVYTVVLSRFTQK